jgi:dTDP-4-amino-4,6-dideoxygalactose transaminase
MRAALGMVQLRKVEAGNTKRREIILTYREKLKNLQFIEIPFLAAPEGSAHHLFPVLLQDGVRRADFMATLAGQGIQTSIHYPPIHRFSSYLSLLPLDHRLPVTEDVCSREVTLPLFPHMSEDQLRRVVQAVKNFS